MIKKVTKLALFSRVVVIILQVFSNTFIADHNATNVFDGASSDNTTISSEYPHTSTADNFIHWLFGGLRNWDGEYFLHIADHWYSYEHTLTFYPLFPMIVGVNAKIMYYLLGLGLNYTSWCLLVATILNVFLFCEAANKLYVLTYHIFNDVNKSWNVVVLFCINPASIFFSAVYSESLFCWLTFSLMLECIVKLRLRCITSALGLAIITQSYGLASIGMVIFFLLRKLILNSSQRKATLKKLLICPVACLLPLTIFNYYAFDQFCRTESVIEHKENVIEYARLHNYVLAGHRQDQNSPWCDMSLPFPFLYVESRYWNFGFLKYYEWNHLPYFIVAIPIIVFTFWHIFLYFKKLARFMYPDYDIIEMLQEFKSLPIIIHSLFLTIVCTFFVQIEMSTRVLCSATPCLYWFAADHLPKLFGYVRMRSNAGAILLFCSYYSVGGVILFNNNFAWLYTDKYTNKFQISVNCQHQ